MACSALLHMCSDRMSCGQLVNSNFVGVSGVRGVGVGAHAMATPEPFTEDQVVGTCTGNVPTCYAAGARVSPIEDCYACKKVHVHLHPETKHRENIIKQTRLQGNIMVPFGLQP